jgi:hypothetical protein
MGEVLDGGFEHGLEDAKDDDVLSGFSGFWKLAVG